MARGGIRPALTAPFRKAAVASHGVCGLAGRGQVAPTRWRVRWYAAQAPAQQQWFPTSPPVTLSITPLDIARLPKLGFSGRVIVVNKPEDEERVRPLFAGETIVGFDSEAKPTSALSPKSRTALMQVSSEHVAVLWRVGEMGGPTPWLRSLLEDSSVTKVSQGAASELTGLREEFGMSGQGFVDLHHIALNLRTTPRSLQGLVALFLRRRLSKEQRLTDWEQSPLSQAQIEYAAIDAFASRQVLLAMRSAYSCARLDCERVLTGSRGILRGGSAPGEGLPAVGASAEASLGESAARTVDGQAGAVSQNGPGRGNGAAAPQPATNKAHQRLVAACVSGGHVLRFDGFESSPGGFRCVFSVEVRKKGRRSPATFRSKQVHATIRGAQDDAAEEALAHLAGLDAGGDGGDGTTLGG